MAKICTPEELEILITTCMARRYSTKESLEFLKSKGINISERSFFEVKSRQRNNLGKRTRPVLENLLSEHLKRISEFERIDEEMWALYKAADNHHLKLNTLNSIINVQNNLSRLVSETLTIVERQREWFNFLPIGDKLDVQKFLEQKRRSLETPIDVVHGWTLLKRDKTLEELNQEREEKLEHFIESEDIDNSNY